MDEQRMTGETGDKNAVIDQKLRQFFDGKIVRKRMDKFRQINRFLEFIEDILGEEGLRRSVVVASTSDAPDLVKINNQSDSAGRSD